MRGEKCRREEDRICENPLVLHLSLQWAIYFTRDKKIRAVNNNSNNKKSDKKEEEPNVNALTVTMGFCNGSHSGKVKVNLRWDVLVAG
jgi:hypothetical protein